MIITDDYLHITMSTIWNKYSIIYCIPLQQISITIIVNDFSSYYIFQIALILDFL